MRISQGNDDEATGGKHAHDRRDAAHGKERQSAAEAWANGRLRQAEKLLERFVSEFDKCEPQDPKLLDYYRWTGEPHYRTEYGWSDGRPEDADEDPSDVIERVNC